MITESRQKRILLLIITVLFLANVATLVMFFIARPEKKKQGTDARKEKMQSYLKKELGYNEAQLGTYQNLSGKHKVTVDSMFNHIKKEKESQLRQLSAQDFNDSVIVQAAERIAENQKSIELIMLKHLKNVRALGNEDQKLKFDTGFLHYMNRNKAKNKK